MLSAALLPQVRAEACISLQASWEQVNSSNCPNHVRRTKSSIKKQIIVCRTVRSMFGEQTFAQSRMGFRHATPTGSKICLERGRNVVTVWMNLSDTATVLMHGQIMSPGGPSDCDLFWASDQSFVYHCWLTPSQLCGWCALWQFVCCACVVVMGMVVETKLLKELRQGGLCEFIMN